MKDRPIIFTGESVRAILAGHKTQTRRIACSARGELMSWDGKVAVFGDRIPDDPVPLKVKAPAVAGQRLWVKEKWRTHERPSDGTDGVVYAADDAFRPIDDDDMDTAEAWRAVYREGWRSPLFMPRWASRITLEVTDVRCQELQSIDELDALAEGVEGRVVTGTSVAGGVATTGEFIVGSARDAYAVEWDRINGKRAPWASGPWVFAITFKRVESR